MSKYTRIDESVRVQAGTRDEPAEGRLVYSASATNTRTTPDLYPSLISGRHGLAGSLWSNVGWLSKLIEFR